MKNYFLFFLLVIILSNCENSKAKIIIPEGKEIYIPKDLKSNDFNSNDSKWSYHRMVTSENFVVFWEKGFGDDLNNPPLLEGKPMKVDLNNLIKKLERFYSLFRNDMKFVRGKSNADKYRMMVMINYSLEGTAYGGDYDGVIGALWVSPNRIQDEKLNCIAHELGHSFQSQIICDGQGEAWGGSGFFEMASQWMLWQVNPEWITDEKYHWDAFSKLTHKAYLHMDNIYHSPYILEYWSQKNGLSVIPDLFIRGKKNEDPVMTYKMLYNLLQEDFCDEMFKASSHLVNMDFKRVFKETRPYSKRLISKFDSLEDGWLRISSNNIPENYGFNAMELVIPSDRSKVTIDFIGEKGDVNTDKAGWRYGFVAITDKDESLYGEICKNKVGTTSYTFPKNKTIESLWFVVMGAPTEHWRNETTSKDAQWPYKIKINGTSLK